VSGSHQARTPDLDEIIDGVSARLPGVQCQQLPVTHASDDDGLWFFRLPGRDGEVQIESSNGTCPFLIETDRSRERHVGTSVEDVVATVVRWLSE
jgi:hypothetical protein